MTPTSRRPHTCLLHPAVVPTEVALFPTENQQLHLQIRPPTLLPQLPYLPLEEEGKNNKTRTEQQIRERICTKEKLKSTVCWDFAVCAGHRRRGRKEEAVSDLPCCLNCLRQRVNPRAASDGGAWRRRAATVSVTQKPSNTVSVLRCS